MATAENEKMTLMLLRSSGFPKGFFRVAYGFPKVFLRFFEWLPKVFLVVSQGFSSGFLMFF